MSGVTAEEIGRWRRVRVTRVFAAVLGVAACPVIAQAQLAPQGTVISREQVQIGDSAPKVPVKPEGAAPSEPPTAQAPAANPSVNFTLTGLEIVNATVYDPTDFEPLYADLVGAQVSLTQLRGIADAIQQKYRDDGYLATRVIIPPQAIANGKPKFDVYEGKIIYYEIKGEIGEVKKQIARLLDNLITDKPAKWSELERYLLLARDLPGISLTGTLRSAGDTAPGGVILVVEAARKAVDGFVNAANRNAETTGPYTLSGGIALNSNTEYAERLGAVALTTVDPLEQLSGFLSYEQSIGSDGLIVRATGTRSISEPGNSLDPVNLVSNASIANLTFEYPIVRSREFSLWTKGGFEYIDQRLFSDGGELFDDQLRVFFAGFRGTWIPPLIGGLTQFQGDVRQGLTSYGASRTASSRRSRNDAEPDYTIVRVKLEHTQPLFAALSTNVRAIGQLSSEPTSSFEEFSLGELTVGRGFDPGALTGEAGFGVAFELRASDPSLIAKELQDYVQNVEVYGFFDYGQVYDRDSALPEDFQDLASAGFGIRIRAFDNLLADFYYAQPVIDALSTSARRPNGSVRFNVTKFF